jgi:hypothetical protein
MHFLKGWEKGPEAGHDVTTATLCTHSRFNLLFISRLRKLTVGMFIVLIGIRLMLTIS